MASQQLLRRAASPRDARVKKRIPPKPVIKPAGPTPEQKRVAEVQAKIEAMIQQKAAREKAALTKQAEAPDAKPAGPQTKRQRLDTLLKQMITGQISETDYAEKRAKVIAEPE